jgi:hypothetical protein
VEFAFLQVGKETVLPKSMEDFSDVLLMGGLILRVD